MYFKENWQSMTEKDLPIGRVDIFQTGPNFFLKEKVSKKNFKRASVVGGGRSALGRRRRLVLDGRLTSYD